MEIIIYCNNCGEKTDYIKSWYCSLSKSRVCSKKCNEEANLKYYKFVIGE